MSGEDPYQEEYESVFDKAVGMVCEEFKVTREEAKEAFYRHSDKEEAELAIYLAAREEHAGGDRTKHRAAVMALCKYVIKISKKYLKKEEPSYQPTTEGGTRGEGVKAAEPTQESFSGMEKRGYGSF